MLGSHPWVQEDTRAAPDKHDMFKDMPRSEDYEPTSYLYK